MFCRKLKIEEAMKKMPERIAQYKKVLLLMGMGVGDRDGDGDGDGDGF